MSKRGRKRKAYGPNGFEEAGGYMTAKINKLKKQFTEQAGDRTDEEGIFQGIAIFVNGYTDPTGEELKRLMIKHGGTYHHYYSSVSTTHIIASNLPDTKIKNMNTDRIVSPKWIVDSIEASKCLDYSKYLLYTNQSATQPKLNFAKKKDNGENSSSKYNIRNNDITSPRMSNSSVGEQLFSHNVDSLDNDILKNEENILNIKWDEIEEEIPNSETLTVPPNLNISKTSPTLKETKTASDTNFLEEYYNNSRLHHISTMGAMFKQYVTHLQTQNKNFPGRDRLKEYIEQNNFQDHDFIHSPTSKFIIHIDMDCFFVSVGLRNYPQYRGKPVAVTHGKGNSSKVREGVDRQKEFELYMNKKLDKLDNSVNLNSIAQTSRVANIDESSSMSEIASCNYEARKYGLKNGMFLGAGLKLCPQLKTIPYDFDGYKEVSYKLYDIVASFSHAIEAISCDEMFIDITEVIKSTQCSPLRFASFLRQEVQEATGCTCSIGIAPNILLARMATRTAKPNGQHYLSFDDIEEYIQEEPVKNLPGVGGRTQEQLISLGIYTCGDLQKMSLGKLQTEFGNKTGKLLYDYCRGIDGRNLKSEHVRKSISTEVNYGIRFSTLEETDKFMRQLSEEVEQRMLSANVKGKCITLKLKVRAKDAPEESAKFLGHGFCDNLAKSYSLHNFTNSKDTIHQEVMKLLNQMNIPTKDLRGIGIQVSKLDSQEKNPIQYPSIKNFLSTVNNKKEKPTKAKEFNNKGLIGSQDANVSSLQKNTISIKEETNSPSLGFKVNKSRSSKGLNTSVDKVLDLEVLKALPEELKETILEEYKNQGYIIPVDDYQEAGPSTSRFNYEDPSLSCDSISNISTESKSKSSAIEEERLITSFSQVDRSFLDALPDDVKSELKQDFQRTAKQESNKENNTNKWNLQFNIKKQEARKKKRGRPPKNKVNQDRPSKQFTFADTKKVIDNTNKSLLNQPLKYTDEDDDDFVMEPKSSISSPACIQNENNPPNLCGESQICNIKNLIKEWVSSCETPQEEDSLILSNYYGDLVKIRDIETLDLLLKFLRRQIIRVNNSLWKKAFKIIVEKIQRLMIEEFDATLKVHDCER